MLVLFDGVFLLLKGEREVIDKKIVCSSANHDGCSSDETLGTFLSNHLLEPLQILSKVVQLLWYGNHLLQTLFSCFFFSKKESQT